MSVENVDRVVYVPRPVIERLRADKLALYQPAYGKSGGGL